MMTKISELCDKKYLSAPKVGGETCYAVSCAIAYNFLKRVSDAEWLSADDIKRLVGRVPGADLDASGHAMGMDPRAALEKLGMLDGIMQPKPLAQFVRQLQVVVGRKIPVVLNLQTEDWEHAVVVVGVEQGLAGRKIWVKDRLGSWNRSPGCLPSDGSRLVDGREHVLLERGPHVYLTAEGVRDVRLVAAYKAKRPR